MSEAKEKLIAAINAAGLTIRAKFVPFSLSRSKGEGRPSLNWKITLLRGTREVLTTDYTAGSAHCPAYKASVKEMGNANSMMRHKSIALECETGLIAKAHPSGEIFTSRNVAKISPDVVDVIYSLIRDADVLDAGSFEEWASEYGYNTDSRKAEKIYNDCLQIALKLRAALGEETMQALRVAGEDY